jgi:malate dehydrogenase (oxaloacetate-decarboxylating)
LDAIVLQCETLDKKLVMLKYITQYDPVSNLEWIETTLRGKELMSMPLLNKGTAFSLEERINLGLLGKLPYQVETLEEQLVRARYQYTRYKSVLQKYIYLNNLHDKNEILFYKLLSEDLLDILPLLYTPGVGKAIKKFSIEFRQPRGLYINFPEKDYLKTILANRTHPDVRLIVVTDGEGILGLGDQGIAGMDIPIAKLTLYSLCGVNPYQALPIMLDVGTDNPLLLNDPMYLGWRHPRVRGKEYEALIHEFVHLIHEQFPNAFIHWEDFGKYNARAILDKYRDFHVMFNDDMQGTGVVALAAFLSAMQASNIPLNQHKIVIFGAGTAGTGIAEQIQNAMVRLGVPAKQAYQQFWLIDRNGLLLNNSADISDYQQPFARTAEQLQHFKNPTDLSLLNIVREVKPTILVGTSAVKGAFSKEVIEAMAVNTPIPIVFPLSNPPEKAEATPEDILHWSNGKALIATGSPFEPVIFQEKLFSITQCNNALAFPGIGLGVLAAQASKITENMLWAASKAISDYTHSEFNILSEKLLLPPISDIQKVAFHVAVAVAQAAFDDKVAKAPLPHSVSDAIKAAIWSPYYREIKPI